MKQKIIFIGALVVLAVIFYNNIEIQKGFIGEQQVTAVRFFSKGFVTDGHNTEKFSNVSSVRFEKFSNSLIVTKRNKSVKILAAKIKVKGPLKYVQNFSTCTVYFNGQKTKTLNNIKYIGFAAKTKKLLILTWDRKVVIG